jgi:hypothetical protein
LIIEVKAVHTSCLKSSPLPYPAFIASVVEHDIARATLRETAMEDIKGGPMNKSNSRDDLLRRVQTADSVFLPREVFEALYLNPERNVPSDLRKRVCYHLLVGFGCPY